MAAKRAGVNASRLASQIDDARRLYDLPVVKLASIRIWLRAVDSAS
jgi:hypothetical protein